MFDRLRRRSEVFKVMNVFLLGCCTLLSGVSVKNQNSDILPLSNLPLRLEAHFSSTACVYSMSVKELSSSQVLEPVSSSPFCQSTSSLKPTYCSPDQTIELRKKLAEVQRVLVQQTQYCNLLARQVNQLKKADQQIKQEIRLLKGLEREGVRLWASMLRPHTVSTVVPSVK